ncbi:MAG: helix-turn-helix domain-containing protein [Rhodoglobus sp.]
MKVSEIEDIGIIARQRREDLRISQSALAARAGVTRQWLTRFERGNSEVSLSKVFAVLRQLDIKVRLDVIDDMAEKSRAASYEIPRITLPRMEIQNITTVGLPPLMDLRSLAQVKARIKAIEALKAEESGADE